MKQYKNQIIIGVNHGYGNIKTANHIFKTGVIVSDTEPVFQTNMLTYGGTYYLVGEGHKEFNADKIAIASTVSTVVGITSDSILHFYNF